MDYTNHLHWRPPQKPPQPLSRAKLYKIGLQKCLPYTFILVEIVALILVLSYCLRLHRNVPQPLAAGLVATFLLSFALCYWLKPIYPQPDDDDDYQRVKKTLLGKIAWIAVPGAYTVWGFILHISILVYSWWLKKGVPKKMVGALTGTFCVLLLLTGCLYPICRGKAGFASASHYRMTLADANNLPWAEKIELCLQMLVEVARSFKNYVSARWHGLLGDYKEEDSSSQQSSSIIMEPVLIPEVPLHQELQNHEAPERSSNQPSLPYLAYASRRHSQHADVSEAARAENGQNQRVAEEIQAPQIIISAPRSSPNYGPKLHTIREEPAPGPSDFVERPSLFVDPGLQAPPRVAQRSSYLSPETGSEIPSQGQYPEGGSQSRYHSMVIR
jgi:hypothetical protein